MKKALILLLTLLWGVAAFAQVNSTGSLIGTITDSSGAVVPDAAIKVLNKSTGLMRESKSADTGTFRFDLLPAGTYEVTVTKPGFTTPQFENVVISVSQSTEQSITLDAERASFGGYSRGLGRADRRS